MPLETLSLSELQTGHSNQCVKLKYLITTWMGADSAAALKDAVYTDCSVCHYVDLCFHGSFLPCSHTFWHAIPTSFYIFLLNSCFYTFLISVTTRLNYNSKNSILLILVHMKLTTVSGNCMTTLALLKVVGRLFHSIAIV